MHHLLKESAVISPRFWGHVAGVCNISRFADAPITRGSKIEIFGDKEWLVRIYSSMLPIYQVPQVRAHAIYSSTSTYITYVVRARPGLLLLLLSDRKYMVHLFFSWPSKHPLYLRSDRRAVCIMPSMLPTGTPTAGTLYDVGCPVLWQPVGSNIEHKQHRSYIEARKWELSSRTRKLAKYQMDQGYVLLYQYNTCPANGDKAVQLRCVLVLVSHRIYSKAK